MEDQFYVTLPSNTEKESTASNFRVKLPKKLILESDNWVVGLAEIIYPFTWHNLHLGENVFMIMYRIDSGEQVMEQILIAPGYYSSIHELLIAIDSALEPLRSRFNKTQLNITYVAETEQIAIHIDPRVITLIQFTDELTLYLGLQSNLAYHNLTGESKPIVKYGKHPPLIRDNLQTIYIYCDIASSQIVGNTLAPLLRILDVRGNYLDIINRSFDTPHYVPVLIKDISSIEINIKDDMNSFINFTSGKTVVKLHFRKLNLYPS